MVAFIVSVQELIGHTMNVFSGEVIKFTDVKDFPLSFWLLSIICVAYYVTVFPFIGLGL